MRRNVFALFLSAERVHTKHTEQSYRVKDKTRATAKTTPLAAAAIASRVSSHSPKLLCSIQSNFRIVPILRIFTHSSCLRLSLCLSGRFLMRRSERRVLSCSPTSYEWTMGIASLASCSNTCCVSSGQGTYAAQRISGGLKGQQAVRTIRWGCALPDLLPYPVPVSRDFTSHVACCRRFNGLPWTAVLPTWEAHTPRHGSLLRAE